jgi:pantetheine-phosphate adenylyltransferase
MLIEQNHPCGGFFLRFYFFLAGWGAEVQQCNNMKRKAVYAGSFDILTYGHVWMIKSGARLFDELIVAVAVNSGKQTMFTVPERKEMLARVVGDLGLRVVVDEVAQDEYLVNHALRNGARFLLRGIRNATDYGDEYMLRTVNSEIRKGVTTIFLMPPPKLAVVASSVVKRMIGPIGWEKEVARNVPPQVLEYIKEKQHA